MRSPNDLWEALGDVGAEDCPNVLAKLFTLYEELVKRDSESEAARVFFRNLDIALSSTDECNLNRR